MPPPNITGELHMGHTPYMLQDLYCRYKRMSGFEVLWLPGMDHAAIATNALIERQLIAEGTTKERLGRAAFDRRVEEWYANYGPIILEQMRRLGFGADWSRQRFTMDRDYVQAVRTAFVRLYDKGYIYRGPRIVNWCPNCKSSISDLEVDWVEHEDTLYYIRYELAGGGEGALTIATVRPETMLADTAVAVSPNDKRYSGFVGKTALLPLVGRELPIVADEHVDPEFGTGALKVTPGHDPNDYEIGLRHNLEIVSCIDKDGTIVGADWVPDELRSLGVMDARRRIVELLRETDHLVRSESYVHEVGHCSRCGEIIEPLVDDQWWCAMKELAKPAIRAVEEGKVKFEPERYAGPYLEWMRNLRDWNISRQIWVGQRVPVYYCEGAGREPHVMASVDKPEKCTVCGNQALREDTDVLDTWFSSALWPFATLGWPQNPESAELKAFYPTDLLDTGRDIINLWVARMIMTSLEFMGDIPFRTVLIHATIQAPDGRRMSKSLGTGVDPLEQVDQYGADAVRAWAASVTVPRQDVRFSAGEIEGYQRFANKLWQMTRLLLNAAEGVTLTPVDRAAVTDLFDRWILSRTDAVIAEVTGALDRFRPGEALDAIYEFAWHEFADWYLEAAKPRFYLDPPDANRALSAAVALHTLEAIVRLLHPFMPFVTEAIWQRLPGQRQPMIARTDRAVWPVPQADADTELEAAMTTLFDVIRELRDARKAAGYKERQRAVALLRQIARQPATEIIASDAGRAAIGHLAAVDLADQLDGAARRFVVAGFEVALATPVASTPTETGDIERNVVAAQAEVERLTARLDNDDFVRKAKPEVVQKTRELLAQASERLAALTDLARAS
jgi:valyl-tRNA synthetase